MPERTRPLAGIRAAAQRITGSGAHTSIHYARVLRDATLAALDHDILTVAQATAYSALVALFPALIVLAAVTAYAA